MAIVNSFSFLNEADFLDQLILPMLQRLGYSLVSRFHGTREFGKDAVFAELDRFGHVRYHGLQAKYLPSIGLGDARGLIEDCKQAFENPFRHPATGQVERICCFYVANGGSISDTARESFFNATSVPYGGSVSLLDGNSILALDRSAVFSSQELSGERLSSILIELRYNRVMFKQIKQRFSHYIDGSLDTFPGGFRLRLNALSAYLQVPFLKNLEFDQAVEAFWHDGSVVNHGLSQVTSDTTTASRRKFLMAEIVAWERNLEKSALTVERIATLILKSLGMSATPRSAVESLDLSGAG